MKNLIKVTMCALMLFGTSGCGSKRESLDSQGVKDNFKKLGFEFGCLTSNGELSCMFYDKENAFMYMGSFGSVYFADETVYSFKDAKVIDGNGDESKLRSEYKETLKKADITEEEVITTLEDEFKKYKASVEKEQEELENKEYAAGERVVIKQNDNEVAAFTFNSAKATDERNQFDDSGAKQVVLINYTVENIDVDDDLYLSSVSMTVIGDDGSVSDTYPVSGEYAKPCPKGAKSTGDEAYGFKTPTKKIKIRVQMYINSEKVTRNFILDVK